MNILDEIKLAFKQSDNTVTQLIIVNVIVFALLGISKVVLLLSGQNAIYDSISKFFLLPSQFDIFLTRPWTLISYFFSHVGLFHILFNMLFLFWFGRILSDFLGNQKILSLYFLGGLAGGILFLMMYNFLPFYIQRGPANLLGASASIYAIMVGTATLVPDYEIRLFFIGRVKLKWMVTVYLFISFLGTVGANAGGDLAHLGGAALGYFYIKQLQKGNDWGVPVVKTLNWFGNLFKPKPKIKVSYRADKSKKKTETNNSSSTYKKPNQGEIDRILDKISESGYESLSKEEKQLLFQASNK